MKHMNTTFLGFNSLSDYLQTVIGWKYKTCVIISAFIAGVVGFIENWIYPKPELIYLLLVLLIMDVVTAVIRSVKNKTLSSRRLPRIVGVVFTYCTLIALSWHMALYQDIFAWLPAFLFTAFYSTLFLSIVENVVEIGWLPGTILVEIKEKILSLFKKKN